jgi:hypothetical protein
MQPIDIIECNMTGSGIGARVVEKGIMEKVMRDSLKNQQFRLLVLY